MEIFNFIGDFFSKNVLLSLGAATLIGLIFNRLVKLIGLPNVTGYLVAGVIIGPSIFQVIPGTFIEGLTLLVNVALGFIAFSIGSEFHIKKIAKIGKSVFVITIFQAVITTAAVDIALLAFGPLLGIPPSVAICLGAIATATAPAATLMVIHQYNAKGPITDILMPVVALDDAIGLMVFSISLSVAKLFANPNGTISVVEMLVDPLLEILLSLLVGAVIGIVLTVGLGFFHSRSNRLTAIIGAVFLGTSISEIFELSSLLLCMAIGAVMANFYHESEKMVDLTEHWTPIILMLFFIISGAEIDLSIIPTVGILGLIYLLSRSLGKYFGARIGATIVKESPNVKKYLGIALLPQAGVAIGMSQIVVANLPTEQGIQIRTVVLCATLVYELVGPLLTKLVLTKAGEIEKGHKGHHDMITVKPAGVDKKSK